MAFVLGGAAFAATMLGGTFALFRRDRLHLILGFSAGAVLGVALFDLLPEAFNLATRATRPRPSRSSSPSASSASCS